MGGNDTSGVPIYLQTAPGDYARLPTARLHCRTKGLPPRDRTVGSEIARPTDSTAAGIYTHRRQTRAARFSSAAAEEFPFRDRISTWRLAPPTNHRLAGEVSHRLGLG